MEIDTNAEHTNFCEPEYLRPPYNGDKLRWLNENSKASFRGTVKSEEFWKQQ